MSRNIRNKLKKGFTLAEMLMVVAIIGILAAFGFVNVARYQKTLKQTELDNMAREIFVAAQNHATVSDASGAWESYVNNHQDKLGTAMSTAVEDTPVDYDDALAAAGYDASKDTEWSWGTWGKENSSNTPAKHAFYAITVDADNSGDNNSILSLLLPYDSIDETLRKDKNIIIEYDADTATVYGVWYSESAITYNSSWNDLRKDKDGRMNNKPQVGYYGGAVQKNEDAKSELQPFSAIIRNDDKLTLEVAVKKKRDENNQKVDENYNLVAKVEGETSKASVTIILNEEDKDFEETISDPVIKQNVLKNTENKQYRLYVYNLDSITNKNQHFYDRFYTAEYKFIPGEDLKVTVTETLSGNVNPSAKETVVLRANSLFANGSVDQEKGTALIAYGRHLQNLSTYVSNVNSDNRLTISSAKLIKNIDWSKYTATSTESTNDLGKVETSDRYTVEENRIIGKYVFDSDNKESENGAFYSIYNKRLKNFEGNNYEISNLIFQGVTVDPIKNGDGSTQRTLGAGLFAQANDLNSGKFTIKNVSLVNPSFVQNRNLKTAGFLIGQTYQNREDSMIMSNCHVKTTDGKELSVSLGSNEIRFAGGLIGSVSGKNTIQNSDIIADNISIAGNKASGGLVGHYFAEELTIKDSKVGNENTVISVNSSGNEGNAGGVLGEAIFNQPSKNEAIVSLKRTTVDGINITVNARGTSGNAGGLVGSMADGKSLTITDSYLTSSNNSENGITKIFAGYNAGGLVGFTQTINTDINTTIENGNIENEDNSKVVNANAISVEGKESAGGLIGYSSSDLTVKNASVFSTGMTYILGGAIEEESGNNVTLSRSTSIGFAGGMVGHAEKNIDISDSKVNASNLTVHARANITSSGSGDDHRNMAGGLVGGTTRSGNNAVFSVNNSTVSADTLDVFAGVENELVIPIDGRTGDQGRTKYNHSALAGGAFGYIRPGSVTANLSGITVKANSQLLIRSDQMAGGLIGEYLGNGGINITDSHVIGGGNSDLIEGGNYVGGFAGYLSMQMGGKLNIDKCSTTAYVRKDGNLTQATNDGEQKEYDESGVGGFIGDVRNIGITSSITNSYVGGRTSEGQYVTATDSSSKGRFNVQWINPQINGQDNNNISNGGNGGFIGTLEIDNDHYDLLIQNCYTTASVFTAAEDNTVTAPAADVTGSFIGHAIGAGGTVRVTDCYSTGRIETTSTLAGATRNFYFSGKVDNDVKLHSVSKNNYYLKGINKNGITGIEKYPDEVKGASDGEDGTPFAIQSIKAVAYPYDSSLSSPYPYDAKGLAKFYGDWPTVFEDNTNTFDREFSIIYYELVQSNANETPRAYYHGYASELVDPNSINTTIKEVWTPSVEAPNNGRGLLTGHKQYVAEDGYLLCVDKKYKPEDIRIHTGSKVETLKELIDNKTVTLYEKIGEQLGLKGYNIYLVDRSMQAANLHATTWQFSTKTSNQYNMQDKNSWLNLGTFKFNPIFADTVTQITSEDFDTKTFAVRSGQQLSYLFNTANGGNYNGAWNGNIKVQQQLDISYKKDDVKYTSQGNIIENVTQKYGGTYKSYNIYQSPTLTQLAGPYESVTPSGSGTDYYTLDGLNNTFIQQINGGTLKNIHVINYTPANANIFFVADNQGTIDDVLVDYSTAGFTSSNLKTISKTSIKKFYITSNVDSVFVSNMNNNDSTLENINIDDVEFGDNVVIGKAGSSSGIVGFTQGKVSNFTVNKLVIPTNAKLVGSDWGVIGKNTGTVTDMKTGSIAIEGTSESPLNASGVTNSFGLIGENTGAVSFVGNTISNVDFENITFASSVNGKIGIIGNNSHSIDSFTANNIKLFNLTIPLANNAGVMQANTGFIGNNTGAIGGNAGDKATIVIGNYQTSGNGMFVKNSGTVNNVSISNSTMEMNGFAEETSSSVANVTFDSVTIGKNGFAEKDNSPLKKLVIKNATIGANGVADQANQTAEDITLENISNIGNNGYANTIGNSLTRLTINNTVIQKNGVADSNNSTVDTVNFNTVSIGGYGIVKDNNANSALKNMAIYNVSIGKDGICETNKGTISDNTIKNALIKGNGCATNNTDGQTISNVSIINAQIEKNGFVENDNNASIRNCFIYGDPAEYKTYSENSNLTNKYYHTNTNVKVGNTNDSVQVVHGYDLITIGLPVDSDPSTTEFKNDIAGFANTIESYGSTVENCSVTGIVYGKNASGFFGTIKGHQGVTIRNSYSNTIIYGHDEQGYASAFGMAVEANYNTTISDNHVLGETHNTNGSTSGFIGYVREGDQNWDNFELKNNYALVWSAEAKDHYVFMGANSSRRSENNTYMNQTSLSQGCTLHNENMTNITGKNLNEMKDNVSQVPTVKYGQFNTIATDTVYPFTMPQGMTHYGDWPNTATITIITNADSEPSTESTNAKPNSLDDEEEPLPTETPSDELNGTGGDTSPETTPSAGPTVSADAIQEETPEATENPVVTPSASPVPSDTPVPAEETNTEIVETMPPESTAAASEMPSVPSPEASVSGGGTGENGLIRPVKLHLLEEESSPEPTTDNSKSEDNKETAEPTVIPDTTPSPTSTDAPETEEQSSDTFKEEKQVVIGSEFDLSAIHPVRKGYTLVGWKVKEKEDTVSDIQDQKTEIATGDNKVETITYTYKPDDVITIEGDMTLEAVWVRNGEEGTGSNGAFTDWIPSKSTADNPYPGNTDNCTWTAWQLVYDTLNMKLPAWGNAGNWLIRARNAGYVVSSKPRMNSLVVFSNHVGFVSEVSEDGQNVYIKEGNYAGKYHEGWWSAFGARHGQIRYGYIYLGDVTNTESDITEEEIQKIEKEQEELVQKPEETQVTVEIIVNENEYVGFSEEQFLASIEEKGLKPGARTEQESDNTPGTVLSHSNGYFQKEGTVDYTVAVEKKKETAVIQENEFDGTSEEEFLAALKYRGLKPGIKTIDTTSDKPEGTILKHVSGTIPLGMPVDYTVAGKKTEPDVIPSASATPSHSAVISTESSPSATPSHEATASTSIAVDPSPSVSTVPSEEVSTDPEPAAPETQPLSQITNSAQIESQQPASEAAVTGSPASSDQSTEIPAPAPEPVNESPAEPAVQPNVYQPSGTAETPAEQ